MANGAGASTASHAGCQLPTARATAGQNKIGARPIVTHTPASASIGPRIQWPHSCACAAACVRGAPRKIIAPAFAKLASASAPAIASMIAAGMAAHAGGPLLVAASNRPRYTSHSLTKPLSGGRPETAREPSANNPAVHGIVRHNPPSRLISRVPVACSTEPAPKNNSDLNAP